MPIVKIKIRPLFIQKEERTKSYIFWFLILLANATLYVSTSISSSPYHPRFSLACLGCHKDIIFYNDFARIKFFSSLTFYFLFVFCIAPSTAFFVILCNISIM